MAKYTVIHTCGHESIKDLFGKNSDRERKIAYYESLLCDDCYAQELARERNAEWVVMNYAEYKKKIFLLSKARL